MCNLKRLFPIIKSIGEMVFFFPHPVLVKMVRFD